MASLILLNLKLKEELKDDKLDLIKAEFERKLKAKVKKEKNKGKKLEWTLKAKEPALVEDAGITKIFKRAKLPKVLKSIEITPMK